MIPEDDEAPLIGSQLSVYHSLHKKQGGTAVDSVPDCCVGRKPGYQFQAPCDAGSFFDLQKLFGF